MAVTSPGLLTECPGRRAGSWAGLSLSHICYLTFSALSLPKHCYVASCPACPGTFAEWGLAGPLRGVAGHTGDGDLADELEALVAEEAQRLARLVVMLVQCLVAVLRHPGVQARLILHCREHASHMPGALLSEPPSHPSQGAQTHGRTWGPGRSIWACPCPGCSR